MQNDLPDEPDVKLEKAQRAIGRFELRETASQVCHQTSRLRSKISLFFRDTRTKLCSKSRICTSRLSKGRTMPRNGSVTGRRRKDY